MVLSPGVQLFISLNTLFTSGTQWSVSQNCDTWSISREVPSPSKVVHCMNCGDCISSRSLVHTLLWRFWISWWAGFRKFFSKRNSEAFPSADRTGMTKLAARNATNAREARIVTSLNPRKPGSMIFLNFFHELLAISNICSVRWVSLRNLRSGKVARMKKTRQRVA